MNMGQSHPLEWSASSTTKMTWDDAQTWCSQLREGGHADWRLPTIKELVSLVNYDKVGPACDLPDTASDFYWSASTYAPNPTVAWDVNFGLGNVSGNDKALNDYVRAVRGGSLTPQGGTT